MVSKELTVLNRAGIHARPAAMIVKVANRFESDIFFIKDSVEINAKSIMGIITLGSCYKSKIEVRCEGKDEIAMLDAITQLFNNRFEE